MARFVSKVLVGDQQRYSYKMAATTTDDDVGKPVKLSGADTVTLCADGDQIYGFVDSLSEFTVDGVKLASIVVGGRVNVILSGNSAVGTIVEAAANTATGVAKAGAYGLVSTHTKVTATVKCWMVISGAGTDGTVAVIEKQ
jgi:hypothetical protein